MVKRVTLGRKLRDSIIQSAKDVETQKGNLWLPRVKGWLSLSGCEAEFWFILSIHVDLVVIKYFFR